MPWREGAIPKTTKLILGQTQPEVYDIICKCDCCDNAKKLCRLRCVVRAYLKVVIDPKNIDLYNRKYLDTTPEKAYAHEQIHVKNLLEGAEV